MPRNSLKRTVPVGKLGKFILPTYGVLYVQYLVREIYTGSGSKPLDAANQPDQDLHW